MESDYPIRKALSMTRIAVVGLSDDPARPSSEVARYLMEHGFEIIPVNPKVKEVLGLKSYPSLLEVPGEIDVVDVFRRPEFVPQVIDEAIARKARVVWLQEGITSPALERARAAGLIAIEDKCMMKEHRRLTFD